MKLILFYIAILSGGSCLKAQTGSEPANYSQFRKTFVEAFNKKEYSRIVSRTSSSFLKSVPEKKFVDFMSGIRNELGKIKKIKFKSFDNRGSAVYHTELEKTWFNFFIGLNDSGQLKRFVVLDPNYNEEIPARKSKTKMQLPFDGTWYVFWGGDSEDENYHVTARAQKNAFDFVIRDSSGRSYRTDGKNNEDYYAFGQKIYSPCDGVVVTIVDSVADNRPGEMNPRQLTGNSVIIKSSASEYILMAHFRLNSIKVKKGDPVYRGNYLVNAEIQVIRRSHIYICTLWINQH